MTDFISRIDGEHKEYKLIFMTDNKDFYTIVESMMHTLVDMSRKKIEEKEKRKDDFFGEQYYTKPTEIDAEHTRYDFPIFIGNVADGVMWVDEKTYNEAQEQKEKPSEAGDE